MSAPRDAESFSSFLTAVLWRPYNLTSLGSANINSTSTKDSSFGAALIFALVVTVSVSYGYQKGSLQLLWTGIGYCIAGISCILLPIVRMYARATKTLSASEAAFRGAHARFRLHSETIALYSAESVEAQEMTRTYSGGDFGWAASCGVTLEQVSRKRICALSSGKQHSRGCRFCLGSGRQSLRSYC